MIFSAPTLVTLYGEDDQYDPELGFWATAATALAKVGSGIGKRIAKRVRAKRKRKKQRAAARRAAAAAQSVIVRQRETGLPRAVPAVNTNELYARQAKRATIPPMLIFGGAAVAAALLLTRKGGAQ